MVVHNEGSDVKRPAVLDWLVPIVLVLALVQAGAGLLLRPSDAPGAFEFTTVRGQEVQITGSGLYAWDSIFFSAVFRGMDIVTLLIGIPLLAVAFWRWRRGSLRAGLMLSGTLTYFVYIGASLTFSAAFNQLFLVYVALLACSLYGFLFALTSIPPDELIRRLGDRAPRKGLAGFLAVAGIGTLGLWLSELIGPLLDGAPPDNLGPYTTMFTHGFDMAVITPAAVITAVYVWQREPVGYLLAMPLVILCVFNGVIVIVSTISQTLVGITFEPGVYIGLIGSWVLLGGWAVWVGSRFFRALGPGVAESRDH